MKRCAGGPGLIFLSVQHPPAGRPLTLSRSFLVLLACLAFPAPAQDAVVPRPEVKAGDRWMYRKINLFNNEQIGRPNFTVAFANKDVINVVLMRGYQEVDATFTAEWNVVNDPNAGVYNPHSGLLKFPLRVGASYPARYQITRPRQGAFRVKLEVQMKVVGWEDVKVPAGTFRALKVEGNGSYQRQDVSGNGQNRFAIWYVPEVKRWVKWTFESTDFRGQPFQRETDELVDYKLQ